MVNIGLLGGCTDEIVQQNVLHEWATYYGKRVYVTRVFIRTPAGDVGPEVDLS